MEDLRPRSAHRSAALLGQVNKYRNTALKLLPKTGLGGWPLEVVCLMGEGPPHVDPQTVEKVLSQLGTRVVLYDELLRHFRCAYADCLAQHKNIDRLAATFAAINDFAAAQVDDSEKRAD